MGLKKCGIFHISPKVWKKHKLCCDAYKSLRDERMISFIPPLAPVASAKEWSSCILEKKL